MPISFVHHLHHLFLPVRPICFYVTSGERHTTNPLWTLILLLFLSILSEAQTDPLRMDQPKINSTLIEPSTMELSISAPPLDELVQEALEQNPSVSALKARLASTKEMVAPAGALPDPMLEVFMQDVEFPRITIGDAEMSMAGVEVSQGLLFPGKQKARRRAAQAETHIQAAELESLRRQIVAQVRTLYARLYTVDREQQSLETGRELLDMLSATVAARYSTGNAEQEAVIKTQLQSSRLTERLIDLTALRKTIVAAINRLLDRPGDHSLGKVNTLPDCILSAASSWEESALSNASEIGVKQAAVDAAERKVDVAQSELNPNFTAGAGFASRDGLDSVVTLRFGVELPLWRKNKQRPMLRAAQHDLESARFDLQNAQAMIRSEAARLRAEWQKSEEQIHRYREAIIPQTSAALDAARASYLAGREIFSTVIEDFNLWLEARVQLDSRIAERFMTWAELDALLTPLPASPEEGKLP